MGGLNKGVVDNTQVDGGGVELYWEGEGGKVIKGGGGLEGSNTVEVDCIFGILEINLSQQDLFIYSNCLYSFEIMDVCMYRSF